MVPTYNGEALTKGVVERTRQQEEEKKEQVVNKGSVCRKARGRAQGRGRQTRGLCEEEDENIAYKATFLQQVAKKYIYQLLVP